MRINILQEGSKIVRTLEVFGVQMLQYGDVSLVYTYEDISKYMKIRKIASESSIKAMKANTPIHITIMVSRLVNIKMILPVQCIIQKEIYDACT